MITAVKPNGETVTVVKVKGQVVDVEERLKKWNNGIKAAYAASIGYNASQNDPNREIWNKLVAYVKENEQKFFTKDGNFRKKYVIDVEKIMRS